MSKILFSPRIGKDLFNFMQRSVIDNKTAINWAIEEFVTIDGNPVTIDQIAKMSDRAYIMISSKLFALNSAGIEANNLGIKYGDRLIKSKPIHRDFITKMQTDLIKYSTDSIGLMKSSITNFYDITIEELEVMPYQVAAFLFQKINTFISELSTPQDNFDIDDIWVEDTRTVAD